MLIDVLVIVMAVVVLVGVVTAQRRKSTGKRAGRESLLAVLAPVVGGSVSADRVLSGRYRGYDVQASLQTTSPAPPDLPGSGSSRTSIEIVRVRLLGARGAQPWSVWHTAPLTGHPWHYARPGGAGRLARMAGMPAVDAALPDRLRAAGIEDAFALLGPSAKDSFPRISFLPDLRPAMLERFRAKGVELPQAPRDPDEGPWLEVEVERLQAADPSPERFRAILDAAVAIAEVNARANPGT